ncbi:NUMOD3 domain-containing DNA-binding protein [Rhizobium sp. Root482]|uniref:NUMOD3 domain-containing DNA-binding protein n=1 Tax=Rhizobium sp. Root482 TaxID=1736543 RepID=UPI0006FC47DA|nr:NUMOD3 domain-containing DNA-binding protein [Rhizobium sp. Root482]KQY14437.1 hypothetical protein ASD31_09225 [Rhizobium sp. Root482]
MNSGIYQIENKFTLEKYVGSSINIKRRVWQHFNDLSRNSHQNGLLQNAYNAHGKDGFEWSVLQEANRETLKAVEQTYIDSGEFSYNIANKSTGGFAVYLHPRKAEILQKRSKGLTGLKRSDETRRKISEARAGKYSGANNPNFGKERSAETLKKISEANGGERNYKFTGYYVTPWGKFAATTEAEKACGNRMSQRSIYGHCLKPDAIISAVAYGKVKYLNQHFDRSIIGLKWQDIGFGFEPAGL